MYFEDTFIETELVLTFLVASQSRDLHPLQEGGEGFVF